MKTSRQRLLQYLEKKQVATAREISLALKMTPANARHHLSILIDQGIVEVSGNRVSLGPGRPNYLYKKTKLGSKNNLKDLSRTLLQIILEDKNAQDRDSELKRIAVSFIKREDHISNQKSKRLNDVIQQLNQMNYEARWEAHHDAPHIILENCPYADIVGDIPEICRMNEFLIEELLGNKVTQSVKLEPTQSGLHRCVFIVKTD
jgi:predicted ArsR family transcriptional regulator